MKYLIVMLCVILTACSEATVESASTHDQCLRTQLFESCLQKALPNLTNVSLHEDGDGIGDVVRACDNSAYYQSKRKRKSIPPECRGD